MPITIFSPVQKTGYPTAAIEEIRSAALSEGAWTPELSRKYVDAMQRAIGCSTMYARRLLYAPVGGVKVPPIPRPETKKPLADWGWLIVGMRGMYPAYSYGIIARTIQDLGGAKVSRQGIAHSYKERSKKNVINHPGLILRRENITSWSWLIGGMRRTEPPFGYQEISKKIQSLGGPKRSDTAIRHYFEHCISDSID